MARGDRSGHGSARSGGKQDGPPIGEPSPRHLADDAESLQQQGERRKGLEAVSKFEAAASKYQQALDAVVRQRQLTGLALTPPDEAARSSERATSSDLATLDDAVEMRSNLAECLQLQAEALLAATAASPDAHLNPALERQAVLVALSHQLGAAGHYACCHPAAVLTAPPPGQEGVAAAAGAAAATAGAAGGGSTNSSMGDVLPAAVIWGANTAAAAVAAAATAATLAPDAAVNAGNCLASLAESIEGEAGRLAAAGRSSRGDGAVAAAAPPTAWLPLYDSALRCYRSAAACYRSAVAREEDALTLGNLGDVLVQSGTCLYGVARAIMESAPDAAVAALAAAAAGEAATAAVMAPVEWAAAREREAAADFAAALQVYEAACALSDSEQGDDLPGLLCNWGAGLLSMAGCLKDPAVRLPLLEQATDRLNHAALFDRGDPAPLVSLGDVLAAAGEAAEALAVAASAADGSMSVSDSAAVQWYGTAAGHMQAALERGYGLALRLRRDEPEALVGSGEVHLALVRLAHRTAAAGGGPSGGPNAAAAVAAAASGHATAAVAALQAALSRPERLGTWRQRCDARYNLACALALAGREQEAHQLFSALLACGGLSAAELADDADLAPVRHLAWFQALIR